MSARGVPLTVGGAFRAALSDFFYNSLRLVGANVVWGAGLLLLVVFAVSWLPGAAIVLVLLALPTAGIFRLAALIARDRPASFSDSLEAWRELLVPALAIGLVVGGLTVVLGSNLFVGILTGQLLGWALGTLAFWGLVATWVVVLVFWPLVADPDRSGEPLATRLRLAVAVVFAMPLRVALLFAALAVVIIVSTIMFAALLTISIAFAALVLARFVLPVADRIEGRAAAE